MKLISIILILLFTFIFSGCNKNSTEPISMENDEILRISGALNKSFFSYNSQYECQATLKSWDIGNTLILSVKTKSTSSNINEQVSLYLYMPIGSDDLPITGKYYAHLLSDNFSGISYKNQWNQNSFSKYRFETGKARIVIEESDNNRLTGKFSLSAQQSFGQRILDGEVENINLAHQGKIIVSGKIDIEFESL